MKQRIIALIAALALIVGIPFATAAPAAAISHDLVVHNTGSKTFFICTHWGYSNGETEGPDCSGNGSATRYGVLQAGKWSDRVYAGQSDWEDVDGIEVPAHYRLKEEIPGPNRVQFRCHSRTRWHKISPTISDHHREFYLQAC